MRTKIFSYTLLATACAIQTQEIELPCAPLSLQDINQDSAPDIVGRTCIALQSDGVFTAEELPGATALVAGDLEGDGDVDFVSLSSGGELLIFDNQQGVFAPRAATSPLADIAIEATADLNGDALLDLLVRPSQEDDLAILFQQIDGSFSAAALGIGVDSDDAILGDLDLDLDQDLIVADAGGQLGVFFNNGDGSFSAPVLRGIFTFQLSLVDLDGDGDLDLLADDSLNDVLIIFANDGGGDLIEVAQLPNGSCDSSAVGDLNQDGRADVVCAQSDVSVDGNINDPDITATGTLFPFFQEGDLTFEEGRRAISVPAGVGVPLLVFIGDVDGDGVNDLLSSSTEGDVFVSGLSF